MRPPATALPSGTHDRITARSIHMAPVIDRRRPRRLDDILTTSTPARLLLYPCHRRLVARASASRTRLNSLRFASRLRFSPLLLRSASPSLLRLRFASTSSASPSLLRLRFAFARSALGVPWASSSPLSRPALRLFHSALCTARGALTKTPRALPFARRVAPPALPTASASEDALHDDVVDTVPEPARRQERRAHRDEDG